MLLIAVVYMAVVFRTGTVLAVQTASMVPVFAPGDAVVIQWLDRQYEPGEVISYRSRKDPRQIISHRIVAIDNKLQQLVTKGDNLHEPDPPIRNWDVLGKVVYVIPVAGHALNFLYTWLGLVLLVYLPALLVLWFEVRRVCVVPNQRYGRLLYCHYATKHTTKEKRQFCVY